MLNKIIAGVLIIMTTGCATTSPANPSEVGDIVPIGKDTYMVGRQGGFFTASGGEVKAQIFRDANVFCLSKGKNLMPVSSSSRDAGPYRHATAELQFRCLTDGDPDLGRPTIKTRPDVIIEDQRK